MPDPPYQKLKIHPGKSPPSVEGAREAGAGDGFVELCVTSNFTFLRGASHPDEMVEAAHALGHDAATVTDLNSLAGIVRGWSAARKLGLPFLVGARVRFEVEQGGGTPDVEHQTLNITTVEVVLLVTSMRGYHRLCRLLTRGKRRAPKGQCHLTLHDLTLWDGRDEHDEHDAGGETPPDTDPADPTAGLLGVVVPPGFDDLAALNDDYLHALAALARAFDDDRLSIAASFGYGHDDAGRVGAVAALCAHVGVPMVASNDAHYHTPTRRMLHDVVTCIREGCTVDDAGFRLAPNAERCHKPPDEMRRLFADHPGAVDRTLAIAARCRGFDLGQIRYQYPSEVVPAGVAPMDHLRQLTYTGARFRFPDGAPEKVHRQLRHELSLIYELGYAHYFLTVHDLVKFARGRGILCQGRGAAANSVVCYCLGVTDADPLRINALFERFVSRERDEPPDIDIDFEHERREEVIQYIYSKYGRHRAALTAEVVTYRGRLAVREVGKVLGFDPDLIDRLAKGMNWWTNGPVDDGLLHEVFGVTPPGSNGQPRPEPGRAQPPGVAPASVPAQPRVGPGMTYADPVGGVNPHAPPARLRNKRDPRDDTPAALKASRRAYYAKSCGSGAKAKPALDTCGEPRRPAAQGEDGEPRRPAASPGAPRDAAAHSAAAAAPPPPRLGHLLRLVRELQGFPRHLSQHVGGFVITESRLDALVPIENAAMPDRTVIEWDKDDIDELGMIKVDVLGLGMLTCLRKAIDLLNAEQGTRSSRLAPPPSAASRPLTVATIPPEDPAVYDMICAADTIGVFQIESRAQMSMLPRLKPRCYYDLVIEVAIVRPGPIQGDMVHPYLRRRDGLERVEYPSPEVERILGKTLGVPLFQEQAMQLAIDCAGFTPDEADRLRRAVTGFRHVSLIYDFGSKIVDGMLERGYPRAFAERVFEQIKGFSTYGFPESHAASFALLVYVSSWIKCHHPAVFGCALLNSLPMGFYGPAQIVRDAQQHGVQVLPVDVNHSAWDCTCLRQGATACGGSIRLGLRRVKGLSETDGRLIEFTVQELGPFDRIEALWRHSGCSVGALKCLARADAFGSMGLDRQSAIWHAAKLRDTPAPLFDRVRNAGEPEGAVALPELSPLRHVVADYDAAGLSLKGHPMQYLRGWLDARGVARTPELDDPKRYPDGAPVTVAGVCLVRQRPGSAKKVTFLTLEDEDGVSNLVVFPNVFEANLPVARGAVAILARGRIDRAHSVVHVVVESLASLDDRLAALRQQSRNFH